MTETNATDALLKLLKTVQYAVNSRIKNVNDGGCGVVAALVARHLQALGAKTCIRLLNKEEDLESDSPCRKDISTSLNTIRSRGVDFYNFGELQDAHVHFTHVAVEFAFEGNTYIFDTLSLHKITKYGYVRDYVLRKGHMTVLEMEYHALVSEDTEWNDCFARHQIPELKRVIDACFFSFQLPNPASKATQTLACSL